MRFPKIVFSFKTKEKSICLTFDDGPHPEYTPQILDLLAEHKIKATFFILGCKIPNYEEIVKRIIREGHQVGNHGFSHCNLIFKKSEIILNEINRTDELLRQCGVEGEIVFRPPYGRMSLRAMLLLGKLNKKVIMWNIPTKDYKAENSGKIVAKIHRKIKSGGIIVLHDAGKKIESDADRMPTIDAVSQIIAEILEMGYSFKTISEMMAINN